jgi:hypothetical protein
MIPKPRMNQNPLIRFIPNTKRMRATIRPVIFASQIAENDLSNHIFTDSRIVFHCLSSSFTLSNMRIFASIAIPIERTKPAIEARVRTTQNCFKIANVMTI